ncbi:uncharacterized protein LY79DRAFT_662237 [Colletotrichum navitas]|uniref:Uncharacterized protein n=1 Tax=Colletotrichum navitas TaxID=681940 RepID=A0AAD8V053_9PEZI|nr:uncharacterized protein LY79DRAFT_662237 [Colletotrichum navitas]KAK1574407.1 hypothetical protein LY79DRAFT_662237 [Colletotrichum navitas]
MATGTQFYTVHRVVQCTKVALEFPSSWGGSVRIGQKLRSFATNSSALVMDRAQWTTVVVGPDTQLAWHTLLCNVSERNTKIQYEQYGVLPCTLIMKSDWCLRPRQRTSLCYLVTANVLARRHPPSGVRTDNVCWGLGPALGANCLGGSSVGINS